MNLGDAYVRPFAIGDAPALHAAVRASIGSLSHMFPWYSADYAPADAEARVAACVAAKLGAYREAVLPGAIAFQGRRADAVLFSLSPGASP